MRLTGYLLAVLVLLQECSGQDDCAAMTEEQCKSSATSEVCSGRGTCVCGHCKCDLRRHNSFQTYSGRYCHCDDYSCPFHNNLLCGGHGRCDCGVCQCDEDFRGEACHCPLSRDTCMASNGKLCNDRGVCECGVCKCDRDFNYSGPTCEECPVCPGFCRVHEPCARCVAFGTGSYNTTTCNEKCEHVVVVDQIETDRDRKIRMCQIWDDDACKFYLAYYRADLYTTVVEVQRTRDCPWLYNTTNQNDDPGDDALVVDACFIWTLTLVFGTLIFL